MKRLFISVFCILLLTGCTTNYNLKIYSDNTLFETISLELDNEDITDGQSIEDVLTSKYKELIYNGQINNYEFSVDNNNSAKGTITKYYNNLNSFKDSIMIKYFFDNFSVTENNNIVNIHISKYKSDNILNYEDGDNSIDIDIEIDNEVLESNADKIKNNVYTWKINNNTKEKEIILKLNNDQKFKYIKNDKSKNYFNFIIIIIILISLIGLGIFLIKKIKSSNNI